MKAFCFIPTDKNLNLLETYKPARTLRSSGRKLLVVPRSKLKSYGDHAFSVAAPRLWNDIPDSIKCSEDLSSFERNLKTYLFQCYVMSSCLIVTQF